MAVRAAVGFGLKSVLVVAILAYGCASTTLTRQERIADVVTCIATAAAAGADVLLLAASPASDTNRSVDIVRKIQEGTKTSSILLAIPACAKVYANALQVIAENRAKGKPAAGLQIEADSGIRVIQDLK